MATKVKGTVKARKAPRYNKKVRHLAAVKAWATRRKLAREAAKAKAARAKARAKKAA